LQGLSNEQARAIIRRYTAAIEGNFVSWMGAAAITARSVQGRYAASENLWVEMKDDHAGMLRSFAKGTNAEPQTADYQATSAAVHSVRSMVGEMSGLKCLILMAVLENTSAEFIPLLEKFAVQLGATELTYTKVHGEADVLHADQFAWALEHEAVYHNNADKDINEAVNVAIQFLKAVFI
jgi:hypothetical protein